MKVGLFPNTQFEAGVDVAARVPDLVEQVRTARQSGFASLWLPHHYLTAPLQMLQLTPIMAYLLPAAKGMMVGRGILILPLLNPFMSPRKPPRSMRSAAAITSSASALATGRVSSPPSA